MNETRVMLTTTAITSLLVGLVTVSTVMITMGIVAGIALLLHETRL